jgi:purine-binding chemotaxis protein CheW
MKDKKTTSQQKQPPTIDWKEIHRRLEESQLTIEGGWAPSPEEKKKILKTRAKTLAKESKEKETAEKYIKVIEFLLSYEKYAIESSYVREIYPLKELTPLPCTPPFVLGIINVHGQIISVIDIKKFFELPEKGLSDLNKVIILHSGRPVLSRVEGMEFGILADVILGVNNISLSELQPSLPTLTGIREDYLKGVTGEQVVILDAEKLLSDKKITVHEEV